MEYFNDEDVMRIGIDWNATVNVIEQAIECLKNSDYAQPIKPYLRYGCPDNRIIAMPAFLGGNFNVAGIKWIASFPNNIKHGIQRAHCIVILNEADTGIPSCIFNSAMISVIRTASVSGVILKHYLLMKYNAQRNIIVGIIGWGPIGQNHLKMCDSLVGNCIQEYRVYDIQDILLSGIPEHISQKIRIVSNWYEAYKGCDVVITCTVSKERYIDICPKRGALLLNVSLRDYKPVVYQFVQHGIVVDDWAEVCREGTDIEFFCRCNGLRKEDTKSIVDVVCDNAFESFGKEDIIMFNPMGMAVFDMAISQYYFSILSKCK